MDKNLPRVSRFWNAVFQVLNAIPDQDSFYDVTDSLEELGMERITQRHMNRKGADLDLLSQFQIFDVIDLHNSLINLKIIHLMSYVLLSARCKCSKFVLNSQVIWNINYIFI